MRCIALIGDIIASKRLAPEDRRRTQRRLLDSFGNLNAPAAVPGLASPFTITLGDEFQALFTSTAGLWRCVFTIERDLHPVRVRFAFGAGAIVTDLNRDSAMGMDGSAFHRARSGIERLRDSGERYAVAGLPCADRYIDDSLALISHERKGWRKPRLETFVDLLAGAPAAETAARIGVSPQAVYRNVRDGALGPVSRLLAAVAEDLDSAVAQPEPTP